ncbi:MAG: triose-phosphate isomerase [Candidatus Omnitrophota bacterium]
MRKMSTLKRKIFFLLSFLIVFPLIFPAPLMASLNTHLRAPATAKDGADRIIQDFRQDAARDGGIRAEVLTRVANAVRRSIAGGNWKDKVSSEKDTRNLIKGIAAGLKDKKTVDVVVGVPFPFLATAGRTIRNLERQGVISKGQIHLAAQDMSARPPDAKGEAYTGTVTYKMLQSLGVTHVILGHSERRHGERQGIRESNEVVNAKAKLALASGLTPIICYGETLDEREAGKTDAVLQEQLQGSLTGFTADDIAKSVLAYEPVWAIGTGRTATPEMADEAQLYSRGVLYDMFGDTGESVASETRILYGGSMKPDNVAGLIAKPNVDGGLIGGAALKAPDFLGIIDGMDAFERSRAVADGGEKSVVRTEDMQLPAQVMARVIRISRPEKFNAANNQVLDALEQAFAAAEQDPTVEVIVLTGEKGGGKTQAFMAGADISVFENITAEKMRTFIARGQKLMNKIDACKKPVIAAVNGLALGGGLELALTGRYIIAVESAKLGLPEITLGIMPGWGGTQRLTRKVGPKNALPLLLNGTVIGAAEAKRIGLIDEVVADEAALWARVNELAAKPSQIPEREGWDKRRASQMSELMSTFNDPNVAAIKEGRIPSNAVIPEGAQQIAEDRVAAAKEILTAVWDGYFKGVEVEGMDIGLRRELDGICQLVESSGGVRGVRAFVNKERPPQITLLPSAAAQDGASRSFDELLERAKPNLPVDALSQLAYVVREKTGVRIRFAAGGGAEGVEISRRPTPQDVYDVLHDPRVDDAAVLKAVNTSSKIPGDIKDIMRAWLEEKASAQDGGGKNALSEYAPARINEVLTDEIRALSGDLNPMVLGSQRKGTIAVYESALDNLTTAAQIARLAGLLREANSNIGFRLISTSGDSEEAIIAAVLKDSNGAIDLTGAFQATVIGSTDGETLVAPETIRQALEGQGVPLLELVAPLDVVKAYQNAKVSLHGWLVSRVPEDGEAGIVNGAEALLKLLNHLAVVEAGGTTVPVELTMTAQKVSAELEEIDRFYRENHGV